MFSKRKVKQYIEQIGKYVDGVDTPKEVRQTVSYAFLVMMTDELQARGLPGNISAQAAARMKVRLPDNFHVDFPDDFVELIRLMAKSLTVLYQTVLEDFTPAAANEVFLALCYDSVLEFSL